MGRNPEQNVQVRRERREKILSAALGLFARNGLAATRISHIAREAGMSQGLLYHYYRCKEEIFTELIESAFAKLNAACRELEAAPGSPREKIALALTALIEGAKTSREAGLHHLLIAQATVSQAIPPEAREAIRRDNQYPYEVLARIIRRGQELGQIRDFDPMQMARVFWTSIMGLSIHQATRGADFPTPDPRILEGMFFT